jgi:hypothetical protein
LELELVQVPGLAMVLAMALAMGLAPVEHNQQRLSRQLGEIQRLTL